MHDFANILFAGPCNRSCPFCIGHLVPPAASVDNLGTYPPRGIDQFIEVVNRERIEQIVLTGTTTDPQLYRHEARLLTMLRERLHAQARLSVHTNGVRALRNPRGREDPGQGLVRGQ
jgi:molybdenum cofactor biosynthesis enzyme MoaA